MVHTILGILVGAMFIIGYIPQVNELFLGFKKKDGLSGVSTIFWFCIFFALAVTFYNLKITGSHPTVIIPQGVNFGFAFCIFVVVLLFKNSLARALTLIVVGVSIVAYIIMAIPTDWSQNLATTLISFAYATQIIKLYNTKSTKGLSLLLFVFIALSLLLMVINIILSGSYLLAGWTEMANMLMILVIIVMVIYYRHKETI